jgi:hypothetical protein
MYNIEYKKYITRSDLKKSRKWDPDTEKFGPYTKIFVFGDNDRRSGFGGQAKEMRGEPNAIGVRVKKAPSMDPSSFYTDDDFGANAAKIAEDLNLLAKIAHNKTIVFPEDGIGTGMAMLNRTAPQTFLYLTTNLRDMFGIKNGNIEIYNTLYKDIDKKLRPDRYDVIELRRKKTTKKKIIHKPMRKIMKKCQCGK